MNGSIRIWAAACGAGIAVVLAGGWFLGVQPQLAEASTTAQSTLAVQQQNQATRIKLVELSKAAAKAPTMQDENAVLQKAVPSILKPNTFIRRVNEVAALDGVTVDSVTPNDAVPYTAPASATGDTAADGSPAVKTALVDASIAPANFSAVPVTVAVSGTADAVAQFTHDIQNDERVFAIDAVQTTTDDSDVVSTTLGGYIYTLKR